MVKLSKPVSPISAHPVGPVSPVKPLMMKPNQAMQGAFGKAQGYLGKFSGKNMPKGALGKQK